MGGDNLRENGYRENGSEAFRDAASHGFETAARMEVRLRANKQIKIVVRVSRQMPQKTGQQRLRSVIER